MNKRWRAERGGYYFTIGGSLKIHKYLEEYVDVDYELYMLGNYYETEEQAQAVVEQLKSVFQNSH